MGSRKEQRNKKEKATKRKDLVPNIDGKENERNEKEIKEILKNIIWLRVVRYRTNFCYF